MLKKVLVCVFLSSVLCFPVGYTEEESITITTYYPSPYGSYRELRSQRMAIGDNYIQGGTYRWGYEINDDADLVVEGNVGIGTTTPGAKLEVAGQVKITGGSPDAGKVLTSDTTGLASWQPPAGLPRGFIGMYSGPWNFDATGKGTGSLAGWALCNGNNGTPNLSDRFVLGTTTSTGLWVTGGSASHSHAIPKMEVFFGPDIGEIRYWSPKGGARVSWFGNSITTPTPGGGGFNYWQQTGQIYWVSRTSEYLQSEALNLTGGELPPYIKLAYIQKL